MQGFLTDVARAILTNGLRAILPERVCLEEQSDLFGNAYGKERFPDDALSALLSLSIP